MAISRAQMGSQLTGNKMKKKPVKRKALGGLMGAALKGGLTGAAIKEGGIANISPAVALAKSLESGRPEGMLRLSPLAQALVDATVGVALRFLARQLLFHARHPGTKALAPRGVFLGFRFGRRGFEVHPLDRKSVV